MIAKHLKKPLTQSINTSILSTKANKNKSLIDTTGVTLFELSQSQVHFVNTQLNQIYQIVISIRNVSQNSQKLKIKKPKNTCFTLICSRQGIIAPGLQVRLTISYQNKSNQVIQDKIYVISQQQYQVQIPIYVYPQASKLIFDPFINFGFIKIGATKQKIISIQNIGTILADIKFVVHLSHGKMKIQPQQLKIQPKQIKQIKIILSYHQAGQIQGSIDILPKQLSISTIDFVGTFCQFTRYLVDNNGQQTDQINIEPLFSGEKIKIKTHLINNSPKGCQFRISRKKGNLNEDPNVLVTPQQFGKQDAQKLISFSPTQSEIQAYQSKQLTIDIQAKYDDKDLQLFCNYIAGKIKNLPQTNKQWSYTLTIHFNDEQQQLKFQIKGISIIPKINLSSTFFKFQQCHVQDKIQKQLIIQNFSLKKINVEFSQSSNYKFIPQKLQIQGKSSRKIISKFCPKIIGILNQVILMKIGQFTFPIKLLGKGKFNINKQLFQSKATQIKPQQLNPNYLENQISIINDININESKKIQQITDHSNSTIIFTTFNNNHQNKDQNQSLQQKLIKCLKNKNNNDAKFNINNLDPKIKIQQYPQHTKNQQEQRIINRQLNSYELRNIPVGPVIIQIGQIFLRAIQTRYFHICNLNSKPICIQLQSNNLPMFEQTPKTRQILPPQTHGGLKIIFQALVEGEFRHSLQYILNNKHFFELIITGKVIQPIVNLSKSQLKFIANEDDKNFNKTETIVVSNTYKYPVEFIWTANKDSLFKINPQEGKIGPNQQINIQISHNFLSLPEPGTKIQENLKLKIQHGKNIYLKCISIVPQCSCICKPQQINFKQLSICKTYEQKLVLRNNGKNFTIYDIIIQKEIQGIISVIPQTKYLNPDQSTQIIIKLNSSKTTLIDSNIIFIIRGGKQIVVGIKANVIVPRVKIQEEELSFGCTPVEGNPSSKIVNLINESPIMVELELRYQNDSFIERCLKLKKHLDQNIVISQVRQSKDSKIKIISLKINPKCKSSFLLQFTPQQVADYNFFLPLYLSNSSEPLSDLQKQVTCRGITNKLIASQKQVNFGKVIIQQSLQTYQKCQIIQLKNPQEQTIQWWVDDKNFFPFSIQKKKGKLLGFQKIQIKIFFYNDSPGDYSRQLQFFIDQAQIDITKFYLKVIVKACASYPQIYFNKPYVILPVVNLNQESKQIFQIVNGGYQNLNLKHIIVQQFSNIDIQLKYLNGSNLGVTKKKIQIEVSFKSDKPISFTIRIDFYDHNNRTFSLPISGTTDCCIYTLLENQNDQQYLRELDKSCSFLKYYINNLSGNDNPLSSFPESLLDDDCERLNHFLALHSNIYEKMKPNWKKGVKLMNYYDYLSSIIKNLKAQGAFLNQIRPQFLLSYNEYQELIKINSGNENSYNFYQLPEQKIFQIKRKTSWVILIYQLFKVYSRISLKTKTIDFWAKFSLRQKTILNWLEQTYQIQAQLESPKKTDKLKDLGDCQMLSALISKYTNIKILNLYGRPIKNYKQKQNRCKKIIQVLNQLGINSLIRWQDIYRSNSKQMLLFLQKLYLNLPSYLQKGQPVIFSCSFGQCLTKTIQISNPSKFSVEYLAKIQGCKAYSIQNQNQFIIESKKTHEIKIKYISNMNLDNSQATLTLTGKTSSKFIPSTFIFVLKSINLGRISQKNIQVSGQLYQNFEFPITVINNFSQDGDFKIDIISDSINIPLAFYSPIPSIKIKKNTSSIINLLFLPLSIQNQKCFIIFKDNNVGQFQYQITGIVNNPQLSNDLLKINQILYTNKKYTIQLPIPTKNDLLIKARKIVESLYQSRIDKKNHKIISQKLFYPKISPKDQYTIKLTPQNDLIVLKNDTIVLGDIEQQDHTKKQDKKIILDINMKYPVKDASFIIFLKNNAGTDLRRYKVLVSSIYKPLRYQLKMKISANKILTQPLPLINLTSQNNTYRVTLLNINSQDVNRSYAFSIDCQRQIIVKPNQQDLINLSFKPKNQITYNGLLKIQNITTQQLIEYQIIGIGQQPQAQLITFDQQVRKAKKYSIKLNYIKNQKCVVNSFTLNGAIYQKNFLLTYQNQCFKFTFTPKQSGKHQGKLIIQDQLKVYAYRLLINVRDTIEAQIKIKTLQRKKGDAIIKLPIGKWFLIKSDPNIVSQAECLIKNEEEFYKIEYYSTKPEERQITLTFQNQQIGEISYLLKVSVQQMPQIKLQTFKVQLGKIHQQFITFENSDLTPMTVNGTCSHPDIFYFEPKIIIIPPKSEFKGKIIYRPSSLQLQQGKILFKSDKQSKWNYHLSGYGTLQYKQQIKNMQALIGDQICQCINFINPFNNIIKVYIFLENQNNNQIFSTILKKNSIQLNYLQQISIPITFRPKKVCAYRGLLKILINQKIIWKYRLQGSTIYQNNNQIKIIKTPCRIKKQLNLDFILNYCQQQMLKQKLQLQIISINKQKQLLINQSIIILNNNIQIKQKKINFNLQMLSFKPYQCLCYFIIYNPYNNCKWIQKRQIIFSMPSIDDSFSIISQINKISSVSFRLTNKSKNYSKFKAYFTSDSNNEFIVSPKIGDLQPYGRQGTLFEVSFAPTQYRNFWQGKLIIQTQNSFWSYDVHGSLPIYVPPVGISQVAKVFHD